MYLHVVHRLIDSISNISGDGKSKHERQQVGQVSTRLEHNDASCNSHACDATQYSGYIMHTWDVFKNVCMI